MITHEEAMLALQCYMGLVEVVVPKNKSGKHLDNIATIYNYGKQQQAKDKVHEELVKEHEELVKDVKRFMEIFNISDNSTLWEEHNQLVVKLLKVGKEE